MTLRRGPRPQLLHVGPRFFGIDEVRCQRRNPSPIVDAGIEQIIIIRSRQIGRCLNVDLGHEQPGDCHGALHLAKSGLGAVAHRNGGFHPEILHDDFLNVAVARVQVPDCKQSVDPIFHALADSDQQAGSEGNAEPACVFDGAQPLGRLLVGSLVVRGPGAKQAGVQALEHQPHARRNPRQALNPLRA